MILPLLLAVSEVCAGMVPIAAVDKNEVHPAHVVRVVDGDTAIFNADLGFDISVQLDVRFARINTPELDAKDQEVRIKALAAKTYLQKQLPAGTAVTLVTGKKDKYGRWLAEVLLPTGDVNDDMLMKGYAEPYGK
jgi:endonuclease YncB( thermonuclease family)